MALESRVDPASAAYVRAVAGRLRDALGDRLTGAWLVGSAALGDFDQRRSDLDVQAITDGTPAPRELEALAAGLSHPALPCPVRGLELVLYPREGLEDPRGPAFALNLNTGPGMEQHVALDPDEDPRFWFVVDVSIARQHAVPLLGPSAAAVFPEPRPSLVVASLHEALDWYDMNGGSPAQTILAGCRTWAWAADGRWRSKTESARWARERLPDPGPVDRALRARDGGGDDVTTPGEADVAVVLAQARAALGGP
jgi:hypothetical protein